MQLSDENRKGLLYVMAGVGALVGSAAGTLTAMRMEIGFETMPFFAIGFVPAFFLAVILVLLARLQKLQSMTLMFLVSLIVAFCIAAVSLSWILDRLARA